MRAEQPFEAYLAALDRRLEWLSATQRREIRRELLAHLADAATERGLEPHDARLQGDVISSLGSSEQLATLYLQAYATSAGRHATIMASKRGFDLLVATLLLVLLAPVLLLIAVCIKLDSSGPVLYVDRRLGRNGRPFGMYKFRSMAPSSDGMRVTRVGRLLRRFSLDELPQLWNVVAGDMSLIGPRPAAPGEPDPGSVAWSDVLAVRPGLTGLAQLETARGFPKSARQLELDAAYIRGRSLALDLRLLLRTARSIWRGA